jgi:hypothetical protein
MHPLTVSHLIEKSYEYHCLIISLLKKKKKKFPRQISCDMCEVPRICP